MLQALTRLFSLVGRSDPAQLALPLDGGPPRTAAELLDRLRALGLTGIDQCRLTRNRTVMVSFKAGELRVHEGFLDAPVAVHVAIVAFVTARTRTARRVAQRVILTHPVPRTAPRRRRAERTHPADESLVDTLAEWHARFNAEYFGGALRTVSIRVSRRLKRRLGHYTAAVSEGPEAAGAPAEIVIGQRHVRRHGWEEALHTLLHEMVHQWQDETGHALDHGAAFRRKAREVGITPAACRAVRPADRRGAGPAHVTRPPVPAADRHLPGAQPSLARHFAAAGAAGKVHERPGRSGRP